MPSKRKSKKRSKSQSPLQRESSLLKKAKSDTDSILDNNAESNPDPLLDFLSEGDESDSSSMDMDMDATLVKVVNHTSVVTTASTTSATVTVCTSLSNASSDIVAHSTYPVTCCLSTHTPVAAATPSVTPSASSTPLPRMVPPLTPPPPPPASPMQYLPNAMYAFPGMGGMAGIPAPPLSVSISDEDVTRIALKLKTMITADMQEFMTAKINFKMASIASDVEELKQFKVAASEEIQTLKSKLDDQEQYSRRMCLRVTGVDESDNEDTDKLILEIAQRMGVDLKPEDIDRSHRLGLQKTNIQEGRQIHRSREVIVKFTNYRARLSFIRERKVLREANTRIYINEDLTPARKTLFFECRKLYKAECIDACYTMDGNIYIIDNNNKKFRVYDTSDLEPYQALMANATQNGNPTASRPRRSNRQSNRQTNNR